MKLNLFLYTNETGCDSPVNAGLCDDIFAGVLDAEQAVFGQIQSGNFEMLYTVEYDQNGQDEQTIGIQRTPTLVFYDADRGVAVYKLVTREITAENVADVAEYLFELEAAGTGGGYVTPEGTEVGTGTEDDLLELDLGEGGFGANPFGPFGFNLCGDVVPKPWCQIISWTVFLLIVVLVAMAIKKLVK